MKITAIKTTVVNAEMRNWVFVKVETDVPGLYGWGEATLEWKTRALVGAIADLEPLLIGCDPRDIEQAVRIMTKHGFWTMGSIGSSAISGIEVALWDILGKELGVPVWRLLGDVGERFLNRTQPSLEAQLANLADEIAYNNHDIDDGLRSGLITVEQLLTVDIFADHYAQVRRQYPNVQGRRLVSEIIRAMVNTLVSDLAQTTQENIRRHAPDSPDAVRQLPALVAFSPVMRTHADALKQFLFRNLYRHYRVMRMTRKAQRIVRELFTAFLQDPRILPDDYRRDDATAQARAIADYIAGMTDRYAVREHRQLFVMEG